MSGGEGRHIYARRTVALRGDASEALHNARPQCRIMKTPGLLFVLFLAALAAGCAGVGTAGRSGAAAAGPEPARVMGSLAYLERIALPPDAEALVAVHDASLPGRPVLAEVRVSLAGRQVPAPQVPVPFALTLQPGLGGRALELEAAIRIGAQPRWVAGPIALRFSAGTADVGTVRMSAYQPLAFEVRYDCGGELVRFGMVGDRPTLVIDGERIPLKPVSAASGARYEGEADPTVEFWSKGREATLRSKGKAWPICRMLG